jgi:hypothetical protein
MTIPRIARAALTATELARLYWQRHEELSIMPRQPAHMVTVLGTSAEQGSIYVPECRADRGDSHRYCALFRDCEHGTTDADYDQYDDGDWTSCPQGGDHTMFNGDTYGRIGWHQDTRRCRFIDYYDLTDIFDDLTLARGVYILELLREDWQAGELEFKVVATVGEPVGPYRDMLTIRTCSPGRLGSEIESDIRAILCEELEEEGAVDYDPEGNAITVNVDTLTVALAAYVDGESTRVWTPLPVAAPRKPVVRRPIATINTNGLT